VYSKNDVVLLDDPFSPLDASVGRQVFEKCIMGILRTKAVLLVTHQLQFLKPANQIILLNNGKVQSQGSYAKLVESGIDFAQLLLSEDTDGDQISQQKMTTSGGGNQRNPAFRRSSSMMEMSACGGCEVPEEFEGEADEKAMSVNLSREQQNR
jgi:ATP-binding cassette subfamily C (CFTR/MRP) protein 4